MIKSMQELLENLDQCLKYAEQNQCEVTYDDTCLAKLEIKQKIENCIKFIIENYPRTLKITRSIYYD